MGIENNTREIEVQNQELQRANREQIEQANKEHEELGKVLDGLDTLDNEAELDEISGNEDISEQDDAASQLDNNDKIEDETSEQFETINNPVYNEVENNGFGINDVNQAVNAKEAYEAEIRDMSQDEYHDQKELDQRVEENGSEPNMTELSVLDNDLHQGDVSNKETDNHSRLNEPEQNAVDMERSTEETPGNDVIDDSLSDVSTVDESNVQEVKLSELPDNVQESYRKYEAGVESPEGYHDIGEFRNELNGIYSDGSMSNQEKVDAVKECVDKLNHSDLSSEEKKQSDDAPSDARTLKNPENSDWTERTDDNPWPPLNIDSPDKMGLDYDKDISPIGREEENTQLPDTGFRYDGEGGLNSYDEFSKAVNNIGTRTDLTDSEKISELQKLFANSNYKTDINIPSVIQYVKGFDTKGNVIYDWPPKLGFDESSIKPISRTDGLPDTWDRYGYMGGSNFADVPSTGKYSYSERAIPYVENEAAYHIGTFNNVTYFDKIDAIKNGDIDLFNDLLQKEGITKWDIDEFEELCDNYDAFITKTNKELGESVDATYGIKGNAAEWGDMTGGAGQVVTPFGGDILKKIGILKEN
mgnify:CR=1 FL=1